MQDEVHFVANGSTTDDVFTRKKDIKGEASENGRDEYLVRISKERDHLHQITAVEIHNFLQRDSKNSMIDKNYREEYSWNFRTRTFITSSLNVLLL